MKVCVCIPARYGSTRFTGKVLAQDTGKFLIQHTYEQACRAKLPHKVIIAADDHRVAAAAESFGAECVLTSPDHQSGTDRIAEAIEKLADSGQRTADSPRDTLRWKSKKLNTIRYTLNADDIVVNLQADEPEIDPANIDYLAQLLIDHPSYPMATLAASFQTTDQIANPNIVKVIVAWSVRRGADSRKLKTQNSKLKTDYGMAIYFSRLPIPYDREKSGIGNINQYLRHLGIYAYRKDFLLKITKMPQSNLEKIEKLEQLRAIENGFPILVGKVNHTHDGIDTPQQYAEFVKRYKSHRGHRRRRNINE